MSTNILSRFSQNKRNLLYTVLIYLNQFAYGISAMIITAPLVDLRFIYDVPLNTMTYISIPVGVGYLIGAFASYLTRWVSRQLLLTVILFVFAFTALGVPLYGNIWLLWTMTALFGVGSGAWDSSTSIWLVEMWPVGNAGVLQGLQFMYGVGNIVGPMLIAPYVYGEVNITSDGKAISATDRVHSLMIPFAVAGVALAIVPILFLVLQITYPYKKITKTLDQEAKNSTTPETENPKILSEPDSSIKQIPNRKLKILLCGFCMSTYSSAEVSFLSFSITMWQYMEIGLSATEAAHVMAALSATYTLGRLATAFISLKLKPDLILSYHYLIIFVSLVGIYCFQNNLTCIYVCTGALGYGFSAMWPAMFAFTEEHIKLTDKIASFYSFLAGSVSLIVPLVLGQLFRSHPIVLIILEFAFMVPSLLLFVVLKVMIWRE